MTICESFKLAQTQVNAKYGEGESNKFSLLIKEANTQQNAPKAKLPPGIDLEDFTDEEIELMFPEYKRPIKEEHVCKIFGPLKSGHIDIMDDLP